MVLLALRQVPTDHPQKRDECFQRGLKWMMTFQCKDGGWAAFDKNCTKDILEKVPFADHNAMLDPECADITARILELLGYEGWSTSHPQIAEALRLYQGAAGNRRFLVRPLGRELHLRHLAGVARHAGAEAQHARAWLQRGRAWLESVQHEDGGWGERCNTYDDPVFKGQGPSTASQTAWAVMGLCAFDDPEKPRPQTRH